MSILNKIKQDQLAARKARDSDTALSLTTLIGELETISKKTGKSTEDADTIKLLKKFAEGARENAVIAGDRRDSDWADRAWAEVELYEKYLPKQLSEAELSAAIKDIIVENNTMPLIQKALKEKYNGLYDGKKATEIIKQQLA
jgi:uncharacterized protein YqeY